MTRKTANVRRNTPARPVENITLVPLPKNRNDGLKKFQYCERCWLTLVKLRNDRSPCTALSWFASYTPYFWIVARYAAGWRASHTMNGASHGTKAAAASRYARGGSFCQASIRHVSTKYSGIITIEEM